MLDDSFRIRYKNVPIAKSAKGTSTTLHNHNEFEILLITKGKASVRLGDKNYNVEKGDLVFVNPMEIHAIEPDIEEPYWHKCICFDCSLIMNEDLISRLINETARVKSHIKNKSSDNNCLKKLFVELYERAECDGETVSMDVTAYITLMFSYLLKNLFIENGMKKSRNISFCSDVLIYISQHYKEKITSKEMAKILSFNQSYFCRNFMHNFGMTFTEYLNRYRVSISKKMLEEKNMNVADVAFECGFETPAYFSKCFKKHVGILPKDYVKKQIV